MKPRLFLSGPSGCGKSTMIRQELGERIRRAGGFITVRDQDENGTIRGFELMAADGYGLGDRFLDLAADPPQMELMVFSGPGVEHLRRAEERSFAVLDELGGVELLDEPFMDELARYLQSGQPCIGVMMVPGLAGKLAERMGLTLRYELARRALYEYLRRDPDTCLIELSGWDDAAARKAVREWAEEYAN